MKAAQLETASADVNLIRPDIERDAVISVGWLEGNLGRSTLKLMGVAESEMSTPTLEGERKRIESFIEQHNQLNWMIKYKDEVVGAIWVDLITKDSVDSPALHLMIGNPEVRGKGIGYASSRAVMYYLKKEGFERVYSRHLAENKIAAKLLTDLGFSKDSEPYIDDNDLKWQNVKFKFG